MKTILHLSDLHFGRTDPEVVAAVDAFATLLRPTLVVVSGDLTQRAKPDQFREARRFLDRLPRPQVIVPGNHDVPLFNLYQRFLQPLDKYQRFITTDMEPWYVDDEMAVAGVNTARSLTWKDGRINEDQMAALHAKLAPLPEHMTKIVVTHHPFDLPEGHADSQLVGRADKAMEVFRQAGADILLAGHLHVSHTNDTSQRYELGSYAALVIQAGTATSTRARGETNSFNVIRVDGDRVTVERQSWNTVTLQFALATTEAFDWTGSGWRRAG
jgi:3',5'-cyclic AMP phosphodiesterase CpdA